jgi:hypothetical protein
MCEAGEVCVARTASSLWRERVRRGSDQVDSKQAVCARAVDWRLIKSEDTSGLRDRTVPAVRASRKGERGDL